jgi:hypothetical protein
MAFNDVDEVAVQTATDESQRSQCCVTATISLHGSLYNPLFFPFQFSFYTKR